MADSSEVCVLAISLNNSDWTFTIPLIISSTGGKVAAVLIWILLALEFEALFAVLFCTSICANLFWASILALLFLTIISANLFWDSIIALVSVSESCFLISSSLCRASLIAEAISFAKFSSAVTVELIGWKIALGETFVKSSSAFSAFFCCKNSCSCARALACNCICSWALAAAALASWAAWEAIFAWFSAAILAADSAANWAAKIAELSIPTCFVLFASAKAASKIFDWSAW